MIKLLITTAVLVLLFACNMQQEIKKPTKKALDVISLDLKQANKLKDLPLHCITQEYPNKLNQVISSDKDLSSPLSLHPAFYGCFDWHSSVHGHWSLVKLLKDFPDLNHADSIKKLLLSNISKENIQQELAYFNTPLNGSYERTYGWSWLLKLDLELSYWQDDVADTLQKNLKPLTDLIVNKYLEFLPKLNYPQRNGTHTNTAFGLTFAYEYALYNKNEDLKNAIADRANYFYANDKNCPISWEPSGTDFLSPCLEEANLMKLILTKDKFNTWLKDFLPQLYNENYTLAVGEVSDRTDGHLVHLDGLNFSRAWCLFNIAKDIKGLSHLNNIAKEHINYSLPNLVGDDYMGGHWLASFAILSLDKKKEN